MANLVIAVGQPDIGSVGCFTIVTTKGELQVSIIPIAGGGGANDVLVFPTIAAMSAFDVGAAGVGNGQLAVVLSNGSFWTLTAGSGGAADAITVATVTGGAPLQQWQRTNSNLYLAQYLAQLTWVVDPQNVSGVASDEQTGLDAAHPLLHKSEIFRRWGYNWSPELQTATNAEVTVKMISADLVAPAPGAGNDPWLARPICKNGTHLRFFADLPPAVFTGTINVATPKNRDTNLPLRITVNTTTGGLNVGMLVINATRGNSRAWVMANAEGDFTMSQPVAPYVLGTSPFPAVEVDTWANGDALSAFVPLAADVAHVGGNVTQFDGGQPTYLVQQVTTMDPLGPGSFDQITSEPGIDWSFVDCSFDRQPSFVAGQGSGATIFNCFCALQLLCTGSDLPFAMILIAGGAVGQSFLGPGTAVFSDWITLDNLQISQSVFQFLCATAGTVTVRGQCGNLGAMYGNATLNVAEGNTTYTGAASGAGGAWPIIGGGGQIASSANAYSNSTAGGVGTVTTVHLVALTAAALDAAAGAAGFGGLAWNGGAAIQQSGAAP